MNFFPWSFTLKDCLRVFEVKGSDTEHLNVSKYGTDLNI